MWKTHLIQTVACCLSFGASVLLAPNTAFAGLVNVALGKATTANSVYESWVAAHAVDGEPRSRWEAGDWGTLDDPNWLVVDLAQVFPVKSVNVIWDGNDSRWAGYTSTHHLYSSLNGADWSLFGSGTFVDETGVAPDYLMSASWSLSPGLSMRYLKYEVDGGTHWSSVGEIEIYADTSPELAPVPEPSALIIWSMLAALSTTIGWWRRRG
jgi:hypothetical protein